MVFDALLKRIPDRLKKINIAIVMGGPSPEREVSLMSAFHVQKSFKHLGFDVLMLEYNQNLAATLVEKKVELVFNAMHGVPGEDGCLQGLLEGLGIPYTGASVQGSALAINKMASKSLLATHGIRTPEFTSLSKELSREELVHDLASSLGFPLILKPNLGGSSLGVRLCQNMSELRTALELLMPEHKDLFAEKYIPGRELTVSVLEDSEGKPYCLPILELQPKHLFYDYECKVEAGKTDFIIPAPLDEDIKHQLEVWSRDIHQILDQRDLSRSDFILDEKGDVYYLETNSIPGLTECSDLPAQAKAWGMTFEEVCIGLLLRAFSRLA